MTRANLRRVLPGIAIALIPSLACAHPSIGPASGFTHGLAHPLSGIDHILAMVAVGLFAWQRGGRAVWLIPATFVLTMAVSGVVGAAGIPLPYTEIGIALSVVVLGAVVALNVAAPVALGMGLVGFFAIFHGHAHGAEMPENAAGFAYGAGFVVATTLLHAAGIGAGYLLSRFEGRVGTAVMRGAGAAVGLAGLVLLAGAL